MDEKLFSELADKLENAGISNTNRRQRYHYLKFFRAYPQIVGTLFPQLLALAPDDKIPVLKVG